MFAPAIVLPLLSRKTPVQKGAGDELPIGANSRNANKQIRKCRATRVLGNREPPRLLLLFGQASRWAFFADTGEFKIRPIRLACPWNGLGHPRRSDCGRNVRHDTPIAFHACSLERGDWREKARFLPTPFIPRNRAELKRQLN